MDSSGEMSRLFRSVNWSETSLGPPEQWPDSLRTAVSISLNSGFPIAIYWGKDFTLLYNDAWSSIPGDKHPWALGKPGAIVWPEIWEVVGPQFEAVLAGGESYRVPDALLLMERYGYQEECYFDYTLSPIRDINGNVGGVFNAVIETTYKFITGRRNQIIRQLLEYSDKPPDLENGITSVVERLNAAKQDIIFFQLFINNEQQPGQWSLCGGTGIRKDQLKTQWPVEKVMQHDESMHITNLSDYLTEPVLAEWGTPCSEVFIVPVSKGNTHIKGCMAIGVSPRKRLDDDYRNFLESVGLHCGSILNNAYGRELDKRHNERLKESENRFREMLLQAPAAMLVMRGDDLIITMINPRMLEIWGKTDEVTGMPLFDALPEIKDQPIAEIVKHVYKTGEPYLGLEMPVQLNRNGREETFYFDISHTPLREGDQITGVLNVATDVTEKVKEKQNASETAKNLKTLIMTANYALMILRGRNFEIEIANQELANLWNRTLNEITGRKLLDVLPELEGQPFPGYLRQVYDTGIPYGEEERELYIHASSGVIKKFVSYRYDPMFDTAGNVCGIIVAAHDITGLVNSRKLLEESYREQQALNEELIATNEELAVANEELQTTNEELEVTQQSLREYVARLAGSENQFRNLVQQAPVAIGILEGKDLVVSVANNLMLNIWGKTKRILGLPLIEALPELVGQPYLHILDNVLTSGETYYGTEARAYLVREDKLGEYYFDFIYQAVFDENGQGTAIMVVATEVTTQVIARRELEKAKDTLKLSINAAEMGTFDMDLEKGSMEWDERCRTLFGISHKNEVNYEKDFVANLHPDDRERITDIIENKVFNKAVSNGDYDVEYRTIGVEDRRVRWVRAKGKTYFDEFDKPQRFIGAVLDITEQKQDEMRKNDFIGMVSHELKTPLTSLNAYVQMLQARSLKLNDHFSADALGKVNIQVKRMTALINGFLNLSRLESGKIHLLKQDFNLNELINEIIDEYNLTTSSHQITYLFSHQATVNADREKIGSVISNLINNAIKYSPKSRFIEVKSDLKGGNVCVSVKDEGVGIKPEDKERLFERYYRVENPNHKHVSGFGIGLYLSAEIIGRHKGRIWVESEPDKGSIFYFTLPLSK